MKPASLAIALIKRSPRLKRLARTAIQRLTQDFQRQADIAEIIPIAGFPCSNERLRLNLLVPTIAAEQLFGGVATALHFFRELADPAFELRVILTDNDAHEPQPPVQLAGWQFVQAEDSGDGTRQIVPFARRKGRNLPIRRNDIFIATAWWTAYTGQRLVQWQAHQYSCPMRPLVYLIQDFEPCFYPWSTRYLLALSTYSQRELPLIAVFNTHVLQEYLLANGFGFAHSYAFEPKLHPQLQQLLPSRSAGQRRTRTILFYGRPSVDRNAFPLIVQALRQWSSTDPRAAQWQIISIGEPHPAIELMPGKPCTVKGKMSLSDYAALMAESAIGVSLMISPHPSYPPLEMAAFGMHVITNRFGAKQLDQWSDNIHSLPDITPEKIAATLSQLIDIFEANQQHWPNGAVQRSYAEPNQPAYPFREELLHELQLCISNGNAI